MSTELDPEIAAISNVYAALKDLEIGARTRVLQYVAQKLNISDLEKPTQEPPPPQKADATRERREEAPEHTVEEPDDDLDGISPAGKKWMKRNGLTTEQLSHIFSLGVEDIDLVATTVPGDSKKEKMRSVFLLKGIAAYMGTGAARFTHEQVKEAALHYDAFDATNFAAYFKSLSSEVSGDKSTGYTLTTRGIANATEILKEIVQSK